MKRSADEILQITEETLRTVMYAVFATRNQDELQRLATTLDALASWPKLNPVSRAMIGRLASDSASFARGVPPPA